MKQSYLTDAARFGPVIRVRANRLGDRHLLGIGLSSHSDGCFGFALIASVSPRYIPLGVGTPCDDPKFASLVTLIEEDSAYRTSEKYVVRSQYWIDKLSDKPEAARLAGYPPEPRTVAGSQLFYPQ